MIHKVYKDFDNFGYAILIENKKLNFNIKKYSESLKQMSRQLSDDQIDKIVDKQLEELTKHQFDFQDLKTGQLIYSEESLRQEANEFGLKKDHFVKDIKFSDLKSARDYYKQTIKESVNNMRAISEQIEIIALYDKGGIVDQNFLDGGWLEAFAKSGAKDPIEFAIKNDIKIAGKSPQEWLQENNNAQKDKISKFEKLLQDFEKDLKSGAPSVNEFINKAKKLDLIDSQQLDKLENALNNITEDSTKSLKYKLLENLEKIFKQGLIKDFFNKKMKQELVSSTLKSVKNNLAKSNPKQPSILTKKMSVQQKTVQSRG